MTDAADHTALPPDAGGYRTPDTGAILKMINNPNRSMQTRQTHRLTLPELCPASHNPGPGSTLCISYQAQAYFLEVFALCNYLRAFIAHPVVRDVELLTQTVARDCAHALGHVVQVEGSFELPAIGQRVMTWVEAAPTTATISI